MANDRRIPVDFITRFAMNAGGMIHDKLERISAFVDFVQEHEDYYYDKSLHAALAAFERHETA